MKIKLLIILFAISEILYAQKPDWQWARSAKDARATDISTDALGNSYITGYTSSDTIIFDSDTLINPGGETFVVKYDSTGKVVWAKGAGSTSYVYGNSISTDPSGNCYVAGFFKSPQLILGVDTLLNADNSTSDVFIAKYDNNGNVLWAKRAGGTLDDEAYKISTDKKGNSYITGFYHSDTIVFGSYVFSGVNGSGIFVVKYDSAGNVIWAQNVTSTLSIDSYGIACDNYGNSYITGNFNHDSIIIGSYILKNAGNNSDIFIAKYDSLGNVKWAKNPKGSSHDLGLAICVDTMGNSYITGTFQSSNISFDSYTLSNVSAFPEIFVAKYDSLGNVKWAKGAHGDWEDFAYAISVDRYGNNYVTGSFSKSLSIGSAILTSSGWDDAFVIKHDKMGNLVWAKNAGGSYYSGGSGISANINGNVFVVGYFQCDTMIFDSANLLINGSPGSYTADVFLAKLDTSSSVTNVSEIRDVSKIKVFPNPTSGVFTVQVPGEKLHIEIVNMLGQKIYFSQMNSDKMNFDLSDQETGIYFIRLVKEGQHVSSGKIIISH